MLNFHSNSSTSHRHVHLTIEIQVMKRNRRITAFYKPKSDDKTSENCEAEENKKTDSDETKSKDVQRDVEETAETARETGAEIGKQGKENPGEVTSDSDDDTERLPSKKRKRESFWQDSWLKGYPWLEKPEDGRGMRCKVCREAGKDNSFTTEKGCSNYRTSTLKRHVNNGKHKDAMREISLRSNLKVAVSNAVTQKEDAILVAMKAVYWLAKEAVATDKYALLLELLKAARCEPVNNLEVGKNATYRSHTTAEELQQAIADTIKADVVDRIKDCDFYSILCDESTDISTSGRLVVYVRSVTGSFDVESHFLGNLYIIEKDAASLTEKLISIVNENQLERSKMVGFGSDGASVMTGVKNGVSAKLRDINPFLINIHCVAHRLALCTSQAAASVEYLKEYKTILTSLFYYFKQSSLRSSHLKEVEDMLESPRLKMKEIHDVRWFAFYDALQTVYRSWNALVTYFDGQRSSKDPKAAGLHGKLTQYKFVAVMYFLMDVIPIVTRLNLIFQKDDIDIAAIKPTVSVVLDQLTQIKDGAVSGFYTDKLSEIDSDNGTLMGHRIMNKSKQKMLVDDVKRAFLSNLIDNIQTRFPADGTGVISAFDILGMRDLSFVASDQLPHYGNDKLEILISMNKEGQICAPVINPDNTRHEWSVIKPVVLQQAYPRDNFNTLWKFINSNHKDTVPNLIALAKISVVLPVTTAICERGFSAQNKIKTSLRNRLEESAINRLMTILIEGPALPDFVGEKALKLWKSTKARRIFSASGSKTK